ncbi:hypothetical protein KOR42_14220 [Thalassoglobus neptunius]|uniref:3-keto-alpha-glucoside-1,2-lyase/3-keto-2-hydroxy-glucal hydratase domain-containing protein n=1 Tax=Thalassoglobus neptunius TaxID=1938619 RepID=A0A5C5X718_9PLAN|nr:DUF1080 domain-containing protein [Thalassoglobus neptunius]TWT58053.1 hypothetical protein KOR42_14220 [Thalassoglobus neptunius]
MHQTRLIALLLSALCCHTEAFGQTESTPPVPTESADGFVSLFDGKSLNGWQGAKDVYYVLDGLLHSVSDQSGNLETITDYGDFILRFEFRLTSGANNGIGLRVPPGQHAATQGMEIQLIDDSNDFAKKLKPYQTHGSVYGLIPAKQGFLKPVGEWNEFEVRCVGSQVTVITNGTIVVDGDVKKAYAEGPLDDREHPGIDRQSGRIALLGHKSEVAFRNIRVKELTSAENEAAPIGE